MRDCITSKLRLPNIYKICIDKISDADADLASFLSNCTPERLNQFAVNWNCNRGTCIQSKFYVDAFSGTARRTTNRIYFGEIEFSSEDLQTVVRAASNAKCIRLHSCSIHCSSSLDFGAKLSYKTWYLSFEYCEHNYYNEKTTDWIADPSKFSLIVDAIGRSGLRASLRKINIFSNPTLSKSKVQEELNGKGMSHISVVKKDSNSL